MGKAIALAVAIPLLIGILIAIAISMLIGILIAICSIIYYMKSPWSNR